MECVEGVKEFLLGALASGQKVNVVENQGVDLAELFLELPHPFAPNRVYQFIHEGLGRHEQHLARSGPRAPQMMSNGSGQMRLAEADATVNKERVIFLARPLGDCQRGGVGELVARPDYEFCKGEAWIPLGVERAPFCLICAGTR